MHDSYFSFLPCLNLRFQVLCQNILKTFGACSVVKRYTVNLHVVYFSFEVNKRNKNQVLNWKKNKQERRKMSPEIRAPSSFLADNIKIFKIVYQTGSFKLWSLFSCFLYVQNVIFQLGRVANEFEMTANYKEKIL